jgi:hypothetical protein
VEMTQRLVSPESMPYHSAQPGVRESFVRVLVGTRIAIDICSNDTYTTPERLSLLGKECGEHRPQEPWHTRA